MAGEAAEIGTGRTGGREATTGVIPGRIALSVGCPDFTPPKGWKWTSLSSVAQLESGHTPSRKHPEYWDDGIPWIGIKDATENHGRTLSDTHQHVSALGLENSSARLLPANTVCLSRTASVGFVVVMGRPMATSQDFVNWVCGPNLEPHYLKYVLLAENEALWRFASGTTHQTIYYPEAKAFHVCLPPLAEQKAIAAVLGALDDKIELNRRMNATLEAMARALFQSWFIDFDPVRWNLDHNQPSPQPSPTGRGSKDREKLELPSPNSSPTGRGQGEGAQLGRRAGDEGAFGIIDARPPAGLDQATAALFPDSFQDSAVGPIPKGWTVATLDAIASVGSGKRPVGRNDTLSAECNIPLYGGGGRMGYVASSLYVNPILFTGRVGTLGLIFRTAEPSWPSDNTLIVEPQDKFFDFTYFVLKGFDLITLNRGSTQPLLTQTDLKSQHFVLPPTAIVKAYAKFSAPIFEQITANEHQSRTLATLRDTLLPKLLSGEITVNLPGALRTI